MKATVEAGTDYHGTPGFWVYVDGRKWACYLYRAMAEDVAARINTKGR